MRISPIIVILLLHLMAAPLSAADELQVAERADTIALLLDQAMDRNLIAGEVVIVGNRSGVTY